MNFYGLLEKSILQILSKFDTVPFCIISCFDHFFFHFRILLELPILGKILNVINRTFQESNKNSIFSSRPRFFPFGLCFIYQNYIKECRNFGEFNFNII